MRPENEERHHGPRSRISLPWIAAIGCIPVVLLLLVGKWLINGPLWLVPVFLSMAEGPSLYRYHYRLTLEVELADGSVRTGSSVVAVELGNYSEALEGLGRFVLRVTGEATLVDLGEGRFLVGLLTGQIQTNGTQAGRTSVVDWINANPTGLLLRAYGLDGKWVGRRSPGLAQLANQRGTHELPPALLPDLVTFDDVSNPRSVRAVTPNDLAAAFAAGVRLRRAMIEVTDAPVTEGVIEKTLPWLRGMTTNLAGKTIKSTNDTGERLIPSDFKRKNL